MRFPEEKRPTFKNGVTLSLYRLAEIFNLMGRVTCELCGDSAYDIVVPEHELVHEQERAREISLNYFDRPFDKYVENSISYVQAYPGNLVRCGGCGPVYRNPKPAEEFLLEKYRREEYTEEFERIWKDSWKRIFDRQLRVQKSKKAPS